LLEKAVVTEPVERNGLTVGRKAKLSNGEVQYRNDLYDRFTGAVLPGDDIVPSCLQSRYCQKMKDYTALPKLMHELESQLGFGRFGGWLKGVY
ncbi:MAG TPA: hypothetical protein VM580_18035, partial [Labilithrix sp.]|nr:hypothetical protein [Labilithrix sp.]